MQQWHGQSSLISQASHQWTIFRCSFLAEGEQFNAENILFIESAPLADSYSAYIDHLKSKYAA
ncbi:MAG: hypothetical protein DMF33_04060 [Verrucomicrobia bacterium]|nr:MAG: hypothetical protein DMF33_04060 [Verrucomicrobiota bacterium]